MADMNALDVKTKIELYAAGAFVFALLCFSLWMRVFLKHHDVGSWQLRSEQAAFWEIIVKALSAVLAILGAFVATMRFLRDRAEHIESARRDSQKAFLEKRQDVYFRLGLVVARIMNYDPGDPDWEPAKQSFFSLYWGEIPLVSDEEVASSVNTFSEALYDVKTKEEKEGLVDLSIGITRACRASLGVNWNVKQPEIIDNSYSSAMVRKKSDKSTS